MAEANKSAQAVDRYAHLPFNAEEQKKRVEAREAEEQARAEGERASHVDTLLTTAAHVGKIAAEPHKKQEMEDKKVGAVARTGVAHVKTIPRKTDGEVTDEIVVDPEPNLPGAAVPPSEAQAVQAAIDDHLGGSKATRAEKKASKSVGPQKGKK